MPNEDASTAVKKNPPKLADGGVLEIGDITAPVSQYLSDTVKKAMLTQVSDTAGEINLEQTDGSYKRGLYVVRYVALNGLTSDVKGSCEKLAKEVNTLCEKYTPLGILGTAIKYDLAISSTENPRSIYLFYLAFSPEDAEKIAQEEPQKV